MSDEKYCSECGIKLVHISFNGRSWNCEDWSLDMCKHCVDVGCCEPY